MGFLQLYPVQPALNSYNTFVFKMGFLQLYPVQPAWNSLNPRICFSHFSCKTATAVTSLTLIYFDLLWFTLIYFDLLRFTLNYYNLLWFTLIHFDLLWFTLWFTWIYFAVTSFGRYSLNGCSYTLIVWVLLYFGWYSLNGCSFTTHLRHTLCPLCTRFGSQPCS